MSKLFHVRSSGPTHAEKLVGRGTRADSGYKSSNRGGSSLKFDTVSRQPVNNISSCCWGIPIVKVLRASIALALAASVIPVAAQALTQHYQLNIPRQPLDSAIKEL